MEFGKFLASLDELLAQVPDTARDNVKKVFFTAWARTFPNTYPIKFLHSVRKVHRELLEAEELTLLEDYYVRTICFALAKQLVRREGVI